MLLVVTAGEGYLMPPQWVHRVQSNFLVSVLAVLLEAWESDSQAPKGPLERKIHRLLDKLKKGEITEDQLM